MGFSIAPSISAKTQTPRSLEALGARGAAGLPGAWATKKEEKEPCFGGTKLAPLVCVAAAQGPSEEFKLYVQPVLQHTFASKKGAEICLPCGKDGM